MDKYTKIAEEVEATQWFPDKRVKGVKQYRYNQHNEPDAHTHELPLVGIIKNHNAEELILYTGDWLVVYSNGKIERYDQKSFDKKFQLLHICTKSHQYFVKEISDLINEQKDLNRITKKICEDLNTVISMVQSPEGSTVFKVQISDKLKLIIECIDTILEVMDRTMTKDRDFLKEAKCIIQEWIITIEPKFEKI